MSLHDLSAIGPNGLRLVKDPKFARILEHNLPFRVKGSHESPLEGFVRIFDFLITARIPPEEKWLMCVLLYLKNRESPSQIELANFAKMRPSYLKDYLQSLHQRGMLNFGKIRVNHMSEKRVIHITDPCCWSGIPHKPTSNEDYSYADAPMLLLEMDIPYKAKLIWLLFASISKFEHPTENQISEILGISDCSVRKYIRMMCDKKMLSLMDFRLQHLDSSYRLLRIHNTADHKSWMT